MKYNPTATAIKVLPTERINGNPLRTIPIGMTITSIVSLINDKRFFWKNNRYIRYVKSDIILTKELCQDNDKMLLAVDGSTSRQNASWYFKVRQDNEEFK
jgi:hypothetical protein